MTYYDYWRSTPLINKPWFINPELTCMRGFQGQPCKRCLLGVHSFKIMYQAVRQFVS